MNKGFNEKKYFELLGKKEYLGLEPKEATELLQLCFEKPEHLPFPSDFENLKKEVENLQTDGPGMRLLNALAGWAHYSDANAHPDAPVAQRLYQEAANYEGVWEGNELAVQEFILRKLGPAILLKTAGTVPSLKPTTTE